MKKKHIIYCTNVWKYYASHICLLHNTYLFDYHKCNQTDRPERFKSCGLGLGPRLNPARLMFVSSRVFARGLLAPEGPSKPITHGCIPAMVPASICAGPIPLDTVVYISNIKSGYSPLFMVPVGYYLSHAVRFVGFELAVKYLDRLTQQQSCPKLGLPRVLIHF